MTDLDDEERANRAVAAMEAVTDLLAGQDPSLSLLVKADHLASLMALMTDAVRAAMPQFGLRSGPISNAANDKGS